MINKIMCKRKNMSDCVYT